MKNTFKLIIVIVLLSTSNLFAQKKIALQHNGSSQFFTRIDSAIINANNGDTIYVAGGSYSISDITINKKIAIYGAGINPDTTAATEQTYLSGNIRFITGSDSSFLQGISLTGNIYFGSDANNQAVNRITVSRCILSSAYLGYASPSTATNLLFEECIFNGSIVGYNAQNVLISNCIIAGQVQTFNQNAVFNNNIFLMNTGHYSMGLQGINEGTFSNNIFLDEAGNVLNGAYPGVSASIFKNNIFVFNYTFPINDNIGSGNHSNISKSALFENQTGNAFSFYQNYHLKSSCVGKNAGTDSNDIGIYGGVYPFKDGSNPKNPHIKAKAISSKTNGSGKIGVNINVNAQDN